MNLDIALGDHRLSVATLGAFGEFIRAIRRVCDEDQLRFRSFIPFVSVDRPGMLCVDRWREATPDRCVPHADRFQ